MHKTKENKILKGILIFTLLLTLLNSYNIFNLDSKVNFIAAGVLAGGSEKQGTPPGSDAPSAPSVEIEVNGNVKGLNDAPVTIVEYSDFECPFCTRFYENTLPLITSNYIEKGKVKFIYKDFPLGFHTNAQKAAEAAKCAGEQDKFWDMHDRLFERGVSGGVSSFKQYASQIGLDTTEFNNCLDSGKMTSAVQQDFAEGQLKGVTGTPAFFINGQSLVGAQPFEAFQQIIEAELSK